MDLKILRDTPPWEWPKDAGSRLRRTLRDGQAKPSDLLLAAELAGDLVVADDDLIQALLAIVGDGGAWPDLRAQAAISLGPVLEFTDTEGFDADAEAPISEKTFHEIQDTLRDLFADAAVPRLVRRRILEAAVRAPQDWQKGAVGAAYRSDDAEWRLTAVFCMGYLRGFDKEILESLSSSNQDVKTEAVHAAGAWELPAAWPHVAALLDSRTPKPLLLAAIAAAPLIRPDQAGMLLIDLEKTDDEEIAESVEEALAMAAGASNDEWDDEDEDDER